MTSFGRSFSFVIFLYTLHQYEIKNASMIPLIYAVREMSQMMTAITSILKRLFSAKSNLLANQSIPSGIPTTMIIFKKNLRYRNRFTKTYRSVVPRCLIARPIDCLIASKYDSPSRVMINLVYGRSIIEITEINNHTDKRVSVIPLIESMA